MSPLSTLMSCCSFCGSPRTGNPSVRGTLPTRSSLLGWSQHTHTHDQVVCGRRPSQSRTMRFLASSGCCETVCAGYEHLAIRPHGMHNSSESCRRLKHENLWSQDRHNSARHTVDNVTTLRDIYVSVGVARLRERQHVSPCSSMSKRALLKLSVASATVRKVNALQMAPRVTWQTLLPRQRRSGILRRWKNSVRRAQVR